MFIEIIKVEGPLQATSERGTKYSFLDVVYKNEGKVEGKKLMDFKYPEVYSLIKEAKSGSCFELVTEKDGKYWQWTKAKAVAKDSLPQRESTAGSASSTSSGGWRKQEPKTYETAAERAWKQTRITRQACLNTAVETLKAAKALDPNEVFALAEKYEAWVSRKELVDDVLESVKQEVSNEA